MTRALNIHIDLPDEAPDEAIRLAEARGRESAIVTLQQEGGLTIREAAAELGLTYEGYLDLLTKRDLPASNATMTDSEYDALRRELGLPASRPK